MLDSGTTFTYLPTAAFEALRDAVVAFALSHGLHVIAGAESEVRATQAAVHPSPGSRVPLVLDTPLKGRRSRLRRRNSCRDSISASMHVDSHQLRVYIRPLCPITVPVLKFRV